jgi:ketosteroid isomerase-like protein
LSTARLTFAGSSNKAANMTTQEVANRYYELIQQHQYAQIQDELYAPDAVSIEPENDTNLPLVTTGIEALRQKEGLFFSQVEAMHGSYMSEPVVSTVFFSMMTGMDVTMKGKPRKNKDQICVFEVRDGKIVKEQFFFDDFI